MKIQLTPGQPVCQKLWGKGFAGNWGVFAGYPDSVRVAEWGRHELTEREIDSILEEFRSRFNLPMVIVRDLYQAKALTITLEATEQGPNVWVECTFPIANMEAAIRVVRSLVGRK